MKNVKRLIVLFIVVISCIMLAPDHLYSDGLTHLKLNASATTIDEKEKETLKKTFQIDDAKLKKSEWKSVTTEGTFLEEGTYHVSLSYKSPSNDNYYQIYSDSEMDAQGHKGVIYKQGLLKSSNETKTQNIAVTLKQNATDVKIRIVYAPGTSLSRLITHPQKDHDRLVYMIFLCVIVAVIYDLLIKAKDRHERMTICTLIFLVLILSLPFMNDFMYTSTSSDTQFHLTRVEGIYEALKGGAFPMVINARQANTYGYITPAMYPQLFLYIPALLRLAGCSLLNSYKIFLYLINIATVFIAYFSFMMIFKKRGMALVSCASYSLSLYFLTNHFFRGALGETLAMIFAPLVFWEFYEMFVGDYKKWPIIVLGITGVLESHVLSMYLYAMIALISFVILLPYMIKHQFFKRIFSLILSGIFTILINAFFILPFLMYYRKPLNINAQPLSELVNDFINRSAYLSQIFTSRMIFDGSSIGLGTTSHEMPITLGWLSLLALLTFLLVLLMRRKIYKASKTISQFYHLGFYAFVLSICMIYMATDLFPWQMVVKIPVLKQFISFQFPWRFLAMATLCIAILEGCLSGFLVYEWESLSENKVMISYKTCLMIKNGLYGMMIMLILINASYFLQNISQISALGGKENVAVQNLSDDLYLYQGEHLSYLKKRGNVITSNDEKMVITHAQKHLNHIAFEYKGSQNEVSFTLPLINYGNYQAKVNGKSVPVKSDDHHLLTIQVPDQEGHVTITYQTDPKIKTAYLVSIIGLLIFVLLSIIRKAMQNLKMERK